MKNLFLTLLLSMPVLAQEAPSVTVADLKFTVEAPWKAIEPKSAMRKATLQHSVAGLDAPLEAIFFHFPGGDVQGNVDRWKGQIQGGEAPKIEEVTVGETKVTFFHAVGTYTDPFGGLGPQENYALLGALIPVADSGPIVVKMAGPKDAVAGIAEAFRKMATSPFKK